MRVDASLLLGTAALVLASASAEAQSRVLSQLTHVSVSQKANEVIVTLEGSQSPDFTTFTLKSPFRVVVDWAGSEVKGVEAQQRFGRGLVRSIVTKQFNSEDERISRVTIELTTRATYRLETSGRKVILRFDAADLPPPTRLAPGKPGPKLDSSNKVVVAALPPDFPKGPLTEPARVPAPPDLGKNGELDENKLEWRSDVVSPKRAPVVLEPPPMSPKVAAAIAREDDRRKQAERDAQRRREEDARVAAQLAAEAADRQRAERENALKEKLRVEQERRAAAERQAKERTRLASLTPKSKSADTNRVRLASTPARPTAKSTRLASTPPRDSAPQGAPGPNKDVLFGQGRPAAPQADPSPARALVQGRKSKRRRVMKYIGFRRKADVAEVFVRCDGKAKYRVAREGEGRVVLELMNTSVQLKNNQRALDTSYFRTPVTRVKATSRGTTTRVVMDLRWDAPYEVKSVGSTIKVHFANTLESTSG